MTDEEHFSLVGKLIDNGTYRVERLIRIGTYAHVYEAVELASNELYAIKCLFKNGLTDEQLDIQRNEALFHQAVSPHPNIVDILKVVDTEDNLFIIMELCDDDLYEAIIREGGYDDQFVRWAALQLLETVQHCHHRGVFHNDLKPENILLGEHFRLKIADFGLATWDQTSSTFGLGTTNYMAPECFGSDSSETYRTDLADVWSLGIILLNLRFSRNPWESATKDDPLFVQFLEDPDSLQKQFGLTDEFNSLLKKVLHPNPAQRCTLSEFQERLSACCELTVEDDHVPEYIAYSTPSSPTDSKRDRWSVDSGLGTSYKETTLEHAFSTHCSVRS
jgi:serine/threonine protein kinase